MSTASSRLNSQAVAIAGLGAIGKAVARRLDAGITGLRLAAVAVRDEERARPFIASLSRTVQVVSLGELAAQADIVVECTPSPLLTTIAEPVLAAGKTLVVLSVGALLEAAHLQQMAQEHGGRILIPTGALIGLDAVNAAAHGCIHAVRMVTRKPVAGLVGAPFLRDNNIDIANITSPLKLFEGSARQAAKGFPANLNVAAALSLAGIGPDRTMVEIWADPTLTRNTHRIEVDADSARFNMTIENIPSENPRTGRITALSVIALLCKLRASFAVGT